jgi:hypothetical protein
MNDEERRRQKDAQTQRQIQEAKKMRDEIVKAQEVAQVNEKKLQKAATSRNPSITAAAAVAVAGKRADEYEKQAQNLQADQAAKLAKLAREQSRAEREQSRAEREQSRAESRAEIMKKEEEELNDFFFRGFGGRTSKKRHVNIKNKYNKKKKYTKRRRTRKSKKVYKK